MIAGCFHEGKITHSFSVPTYMCPLTIQFWRSEVCPGSHGAKNQGVYLLGLWGERGLAQSLPFWLLGHLMTGHCLWPPSLNILQGPNQERLSWGLPCPSHTGESLGEGSREQTHYGFHLEFGLAVKGQETQSRIGLNEIALYCPLM